ncbi:MAG: hypothetical protein RJA81_423 [Planctomycetota bacterium]
MIVTVEPRQRIRMRNAKMAWTRPVLDHQWRRMLLILQKFSGMDCPENRRQDLMAAAAEAAELLGTLDFEFLLDRLEDPAEKSLRSVWISAFTIHETYFFRDSLQWSTIRNTILPERIEARKNTKTLRIWSAGCSSGEEAYTAAIAVSELIPELQDWKIRIIGTDISDQILQKARKGIYREWAFRQTPIHIREEYFESHGEHHWQIQPEIAKLVQFQNLNLKTGLYPSAVTDLYDFDLILCRNVLIYFVQEEMENVLTRLGQSLTPGGYLALGPAEPFPSESTGLILAKSLGSAIFQIKPFPTEPNEPSKARSTLESKTVTPWESSPMNRPELAEPNNRQTITGRQTGSYAHQTKTPETEQTEPISSEIRAAAEVGNWEELLQLSLQDSAKNPLNAELFYLRGVALKELGRLEESREALRKCLFLKPRHWLGHLLLAGLWQREGHPSRAKGQLQAILTGLKTLDPSVILPGTDGISVGRMKALAESQLKSLNSSD